MSMRFILILYRYSYYCPKGTVQYIFEEFFSITCSAQCIESWAWRYRLHLVLAMLPKVSHSLSSGDNKAWPFHLTGLSWQSNDMMYAEALCKL